MPQLDISTYAPQVFWLIIIFSIMLGTFIGVFLPKLSKIFQKRFDQKKHADSEIESLIQATKSLQESYDEKKEAAIKSSHEYLENSLLAINEAHEKRFNSLEKEIQHEMTRLQSTYEQQINNFDENYKDIINEAVDQILYKLGINNGR
jgi:F-type H+-transporting ATPase subunit b